MALSLPVSPTVGQVHSEAGRSWRWTGTTWDSVHVSTDPVASLGGVTNTAAARANLGLGSAAVEDVGAFATSAQGATAVPVSLIDAAGDLIVGTAADTVARLAVGTSGQVLTSNGTTAGWAAPSPPQLAFTAAAYYTLGGNESIHSSVSPDTVGAMTAHPVWLDAGSYDRETVTITVAAVSTWRLGVFADSGSLSPGARLLDAGALNMNSGTGARELPMTITIPTSGVYWLALLVDAYTARPTSCGWMGATGGTPNLPWVGHRGIMNPGGRGSWAARATGVATGAIPATFPGGHSWTDTTPQIALRRA